MTNTLQDINWIATGGVFGKKRILPTFILEQFTTDSGRIKYRVIDERNKERGTVGLFFTIEEAVSVFKPIAKNRTTLV
jgi:hypothetical protein